MEMMSREDAFTALQEMGAVKAVVEFSGGHDEGGSEGISITLGDGEIKTLKEYIFNEEDEQTPEETRLAKTLVEPIYNEWGSFAGEFSVYGELIWDVANKTVTLDGSETVEEYQGFNKEV